MLKPLLGPCDSYQLEPFAYPWAWDMAKTQERNHWQPEEIPVAPDVADYKASDLDPRHKHLFESVMAQLTTFDILRGDDAAETILTIMQPAEIKHFLKRMVYEESLHTRSYRFIIENLSIPLDIYDRWKTVPEFKNRVGMCHSISRPVEKVIGEVLSEGKDFSTISTAQKQAVLRSMVFYFAIFEGVWFWVSLLGPVQQLYRLGRFKGAAEQFVFIARDEFAHVGFGQSLIKEFMRQYHECLTRDFIACIGDDVKTALELEKHYIEYCLKDGPILGYAVPEHVATAKFFANMRLGAIGLPQPFDDAYHAFPWMSEQIELRKEKNYFEKVVQEYQSGGALQFDDDHVLSSMPEWSDPLKQV